MTDALSTLKVIVDRLDAIQFPFLPKPMGGDDHVTLPAIEWSSHVYSFAALSHCREMISSLLQLVESGHIPASYFIIRSLHELAAQAYYVQKHLRQYLGANDLHRAWELLT